jgi:hypothetical protein
MKEAVEALNARVMVLHQYLNETKEGACFCSNAFATYVTERLYPYVVICCRKGKFLSIIKL